MLNECYIATLTFTNKLFIRLIGGFFSFKTFCSFSYLYRESRYMCGGRFFLVVVKREASISDIQMGTEIRGDYNYKLCVDALTFEPDIHDVDDFAWN